MTDNLLRRPLAPLVSLAVVALTLAACLGEPAASAQPTPTREPEPTPVSTTFELGTTVWYEGLVIRVDRATALLDERGGLVEVSLRIENPGADDAQLDAPIHLLVGDQAVEPTRESTVPNVPAGGLVPALMTYELQGITDVDAAVVRIGAAPDHKALVPLTPDGGAAVALEPITLDLSGSATAGSLRLVLRSGVLRWDLPDWSQEMPATHQALTLAYDVTYSGDFIGGFAFTGDNVSLRLPDGSVVKPRRDGHSQSIELIASGGTKKGLMSRFEIPAGMTGTYRLIVHNGDSQGVAFKIGE